MKYLKQLLELLSKREKRNLVIVLFGVVALGILELAGIGSIMPFLSVASNPNLIHTNVYLKKVYDLLGFESLDSFLFGLGIGVILFILISNAMKVLVTYMNKRYTAMRLHQLSLRLFRRYLYRPYTFFLNRNTSELMKNILGEVGMLVDEAIMPLLEFITAVVVTLLVFVMLLIINPFLALITFLAIGIVYSGIFVLVRHRLDSLGRRRMESNRLRFKKISEAFGGIKDVKVLGREEYYLNDIRPHSIEFARIQVTRAMIETIPRHTLEVIAFGGILLVILYMIRTMGNFRDAVPIVGLYAFAAYRLIPNLRKIFASLTKFRTNIPVVEMIRENLGDWEAEELRIRALNRERYEPLAFNDMLKLDSITFTYPGGDSPVIKAQTLTIKKNTTVGLVGPTGCGKTTSVDIILGLLKPQEGTFSVDGVEITDGNVYSWRRQIGYVPQHIYLTDESVSKNIAFGIPETSIDMKAVEKAAQIANIHEFITSETPTKYQTIVGERGIRLSGGQIQRIGIARALYHDPAVLVLDEATSFLDGLTEAAIMDAIHELSHKKTIILIAHRLATVRECDEIFAMDHGVIIDRGTYKELVERNERFRTIAQLS